MSRTLTGAAQTVADAEHCPYLVFVSLDFSSGFVYVCNATHDVIWNGITWRGAGEMGEISAIEETTELKMNGINLAVSGVDPTNLSTALLDHSQGRDVQIWWAPLSNGVPVADPVGPWKYRMDTPKISLGQLARVIYSAESRMADWSNPRELRYTDQDQQALFAGDKFFEFVPDMQELTILF